MFTKTAFKKARKDGVLLIQEFKMLNIFITELKLFWYDTQFDEN